MSAGLWTRVIYSYAGYCKYVVKAETAAVLFCDGLISSLVCYEKFERIETSQFLLLF